MYTMRMIFGEPSPHEKASKLRHPIHLPHRLGSQDPLTHSYALDSPT